MGKDKLKFLEGIRGIMAINVVINHFVVFYYPQMYYEEFAENSLDVLSWFATTPLSILINGNIAVQYFFVLTGFLVGRICFLGTGLSRHEILVKSCNRYLRLLPIVFAATFVSYLTMVFGLQHHLQILDRVANPDMLRGQCNFEPTFLRFLLNAVYEPFVLWGSDFLVPFWVLRYEMWGYILCMLACYFLQDSKLRRIGYIVITVLLWFVVDENYIGFFMGLFVADVCYRTERNTTVLSKFYAPVIYCKAVVTAMAILGIYFAACPMYFTGIYGVFARIPKVTTQLVRATGVALVLFSFMQMPSVAKLFEGKCLLFLGKISFSIYAFHMPVMLTLEAWLFDRFYDVMTYDRAAVGAFLLSMPVILGLACASYQLIEKRVKLDIRPLLEKTTV